jgi:hypothetical protein
MRLLIYASALSSVGLNLRQLIQSMAFDFQSTCLASLEALDDYLRRPAACMPVGILAPSDDAELAALIGVRHLFRDMRIILILPDQQGPAGLHPNPHKLHPRFIGYADEDLSDVAAVLSKMSRHAPGRSSWIMN